MSASKVNVYDLDAAIVDTAYVVLPDERTTICMLTLYNGFTLNGQSACVCVENFDVEIGQKMALADARAKLWPLLGFRLADKLYAERQAQGPRYRSAITGEYVSEAYALKRPSTTVRED